MEELNKKQEGLLKDYLDDVKAQNPQPVKDHSRTDAYNAEFTELFSIRLNRKTDTDLFAALEGKKPQTEMKRLMRIGLDAIAGKLPTEKGLFGKKKSVEEPKND
jgi:hypothetical protein